MRTFAIGDVHGCNKMLIALLKAINPQPNDTLIFLGDLIDRGDNSKGVIETIWQYEKNLQRDCHHGQSRRDDDKCPKI